MSDLDGLGFSLAYRLMLYEHRNNAAKRAQGHKSEHRGTVSSFWPSFDAIAQGSNGNWLLAR